MKLTIRRGDCEAAYTDDRADTVDLPAVITQLMRTFPEEQRDSAVDALVERAEPYERPDREDDGPIGFRRPQETR